MTLRRSAEAPSKAVVKWSLTNSLCFISERGISMEWRLIKKFGNIYAEGRYKGEEWHNWLFPISETEKKYYIYIPELGVWRRNTSI